MSRPTARMRRSTRKGDASSGPPPGCPYTAPRTLVNYAGSDQADESVAFYVSNLDRLRDTKRRYDPDNVFHLNQNIRPA